MSIPISATARAVQGYRGTGVQDPRAGAGGLIVVATVVATVVALIRFLLKTSLIYLVLPDYLRLNLLLFKKPIIIIRPSPRRKETLKP
ncbi:MAG: hypothetical protein PWR16_1952 [Methanoculleus sp.]|nr:hypothetical protein [Methanoculleus sp.]